MNLHVIASSVANDISAHAAGALSKAAGDMIAFVGLELAGEIEPIAVAVAAQLKVDFMLAASPRPVSRVAADALGCFIDLADGTGARPMSAKFRKRTRRRGRPRAEQEQDRAYAYRGAQKV